MLGKVLYLKAMQTWTLIEVIRQKQNILQFISYLEYTSCWTRYFIIIKNHKKLFLEPQIISFNDVA